MIRITGVSDTGKPLMGGLFTLKDEKGFPLDMAYELCLENGFLPDWAEALADAGSQSIVKFDALVNELGFLIGEHTEEIVQKFKLWGASLTKPGDTFHGVCRKMLEAKHRW